MTEMTDPSVVARKIYKGSPTTSLANVGRVARYCFNSKKAQSHAASHLNLDGLWNILKKGRLQSTDLEMNLDRVMILPASLWTSLIFYGDFISCKA